jgi:hypothetical protein
MTQLQGDQGLLRLTESSGGCLPAPLYVSTVGREFNRYPAFYAQQTRDEIEVVYWQCNRIGAESGTKTNPILPELPTSPSSLHHKILVPHHDRGGDLNDSYVSPYHPDHEFDVEEVDDEAQWDM